MKPLFPAAAVALLLAAPPSPAAGAPPEPADLIVHRAKVVTVDAKFSVAEAVAVKGGRVVAVGTNGDVLKRKGPATRVIDAGGKTVLPGLYDSHTHPTGAAYSEAGAPLPLLRSIPEVQAYIREQAKTTPAGRWIVIRYAFPTRLQEARFPTRAELDAATPDHPVLYHAGPAGMANTMGLKVSGVTRDTPNPRAGQVVKDPATGEPTGMLRNAYGVLKGVPGAAESLTAEQKKAALLKLFARYNRLGLTSVADRNAGRGDLDAYLALRQSGELTVRVNVARSFNPIGTRDELARRFDELAGADGRGGPTGAGDEWVRVGPIKVFLDGGMLNGSAYMREPWPKGPTYQVTEDDYRGLLFVPPEQLKAVAEEAARRKWQMTAHTAGEGAMDVLLDAYEFADRAVPIRDLRFCITHANFPSRHNLERCKRLGVCADVQPAWLWKDGHTLLGVLGPARMRWFQPYQELAGVHHGRRRERPHAPPRPDRQHEPVAPVAGDLGGADPQPGARRGAGAGRGADPRAGTPAVHDQQRLPAPRGAGEGFARSRQAGRPDHDRPRLPDLSLRRRPRHPRAANSGRRAGGVRD
jgi:hypothetical protein